MSSSEKSFGWGEVNLIQKFARNIVDQAEQIVEFHTPVFIRIYRLSQ